MSGGAGNLGEEGGLMGWWDVAQVEKLCALDPFGFRTTWFRFSSTSEKEGGLI